MIACVATRLTVDSCEITASTYIVVWMSMGLPPSWMCVALTRRLGRVQSRRAQRQSDSKKEPFAKTKHRAEANSITGITDWFRIFPSMPPTNQQTTSHLQVTMAKVERSSEKASYYVHYLQRSVLLSHGRPAKYPVDIHLPPNCRLPTPL
jgi:hypothetical protein